MTSPDTLRTASEGESLRDEMNELETTEQDLRWFSQNVPPGTPGERSAIDRLVRDHKRFGAALAQLQADLIAAREERDEVRAYAREVGAALVGLTCDGSEFYQRGGADWRVDPAACASYVRRQRSDKHDSILRFAKRAQAAEAERDSLRIRLQEAERAAEASGWQPISSAPRNSKTILLITRYPATTTWSDPRAGWWDGRAWTRWPHDFPPTMWAPIPELPTPLPVTHLQTAGGKP
jgi:hypothetical protein